MDFSSILIEWYKLNKRDLPWRNTKNPYFIWLSEVILQQTRVNQGLSYFYKFIEKYPDVVQMAEAKQDDVLKLWQGLGYYSRAINMHRTAQEVVKKHKGKFPNDITKLLELKGIGEYTAAAILSFSYNKPFAVIDGNVYRVLSRIFGVTTEIDTTIGKKQFKELANELIDKSNPALYNQAIMEFGAIHCKPKNPDCENCCFIITCAALKKDLVNKLPKKAKKTIQKNRYFNYLVITDNKNVIIKKRNDKDIWNGLFDFPLLETKENTQNIEQLIELKYDTNILKKSILSKSFETTHQLSHQTIYATFWKINTKAIKVKSNEIKINLCDFNKYPAPKLIEKYAEFHL